MAIRIPTPCLENRSIIMADEKFVEVFEIFYLEDGSDEDILPQPHYSDAKNIVPSGRGVLEHVQEHSG